MGLYTTGTTISPRRSRRDLALGFEARHPAHGAGDTDPKTLGRRVARHAAFHHRPHNAFAKIVRKRHPRRLLRAAGILNQNKSDSGIENDSIRSDAALVGRPAHHGVARSRPAGLELRICGEQLVVLAMDRVETYEVGGMVVVGGALALNDNAMNRPTPHAGRPASRSPPGWTGTTRRQWRSHRNPA